MSLRLAHISDPHLGAEIPALVDGLRADLAEQDLDRILVTGDLTMRARSWQFRAARDLLDSFGRPWTSVPGNHDLPLDRLARAVRPLAGYRRYIGEEEPDLRTQDLVVLGLSTSRPYLWKGGRIDGGQVSRISTVFADPAPLKILMMHHPVFWSRLRPREPAVRGAAKALRAAAHAGADLVLCGHTHVHDQVDLFSVHPDIGRHVIGVISGTATSYRIRASESQSYTVFELDGDRLRARVRSWQDGRFTALTETLWHRTDDGWHS